MDIAHSLECEGKADSDVRSGTGQPNAQTLPNEVPAKRQPIPHGADKGP